MREETPDQLEFGKRGHWGNASLTMRH
jgi:hypothetical protein